MANQIILVTPIIKEILKIRFTTNSTFNNFLERRKNNFLFSNVTVLHNIYPDICNIKD